MINVLCLSFEQKGGLVYRPIVQVQRALSLLFNVSPRLSLVNIVLCLAIVIHNSDSIPTFIQEYSRF